MSQGATDSSSLSTAFMPASMALNTSDANGSRLASFPVFFFRLTLQSSIRARYIQLFFNLHAIRLVQISWGGPNAKKYRSKMIKTQHTKNHPKKAWQKPPGALVSEWRPHTREGSGSPCNTQRHIGTLWIRHHDSKKQMSRGIRCIRCIWPDLGLQGLFECLQCQGHISKDLRHGVAGLPFGRSNQCSFHRLQIWGNS